VDGFYASTQGGEAGRCQDSRIFKNYIKPYHLVLMNEMNRSCLFNILHVCDYHGPYDDFSPDSSHVIPALIDKFTDAVKNNAKEVVVWGTGNVSREFLYVQDAAEAIILATERYNKPEPVNIGAGFEIKIKDLVNLMTELTGFDGKIIWDTSKPDGQPRRCLDVSKAKKEFGFEVKTDFREGFKRTIEWYTSERGEYD